AAHRPPGTAVSARPRRRAGARRLAVRARRALRPALRAPVSGSGSRVPDQRVLYVLGPGDLIDVRALGQQEGGALGDGAALLHLRVVLLRASALDRVGADGEQLLGPLVALAQNSRVHIEVRAGLGLVHLLDLVLEVDEHRVLALDVARLHSGVGEVGVLAGLHLLGGDTHRPLVIRLVGAVRGLAELVRSAGPVRTVVLGVLGRLAGVVRVGAAVLLRRTALVALAVVVVGRVV